MKYFVNVNPYADEKLVKNMRKVISDILEGQAYYGYTLDPAEADLAISIGGDGTFIDTANLVGNKTDIIGINAGNVGYLAEIEPGAVAEALFSYCHGRCGRQVRMRIAASYTTNDGKYMTEDALNDIVISKDDSSVIDVEIKVDGKKVASYYADGIIISTPTGSTGYAFSCGAPIVAPDADLIIITPVAAHSLINRSIIVPASSWVSITVRSARGCDTAKISCDGNEDKISIGSSIDIQRSSNTTTIVKFSHESFCDRIINKLKGV